MAKDISSRLARRSWTSHLFLYIFLGFPRKLPNPYRSRAQRANKFTKFVNTKKLNGEIWLPPYSIVASCCFVPLVYAWPALESTRITSNGLRRPLLLLFLHHKLPPPLPLLFLTLILLRSSSTTPVVMPPMRYCPSFT